MIIYSDHALERMAERKIFPQEIINALQNPISKRYDEEEKIHAAMRIRTNGYLLIVIYKIVYTDYGNIHLIITVISTSKIKKYLYDS